jgi:ribulose-phosphate 3-epimerase
VQIKLSPSILNADFGRLAEQVREAEAAGADYLHVDVMDGQFVPNISLGPGIVAAIRQATSLPLDLHLMIEEPRRFLDEFVEAGAGIMTVHAEAVRHLHATVAAIQDAGVKAENVGEVVRRGARVVVAGSAIFVGGGGIHANTAALRAEIDRATG